jgi:hypothetical protein
VNLRIDPNSTDTAALISQAAVRSRERIEKLFDEDLSASSIESESVRLTREFDGDLITGDWRNTLPGRDILTRFVADHVKIGYAFFRNLVLNQMADDGIKPDGMARPLKSILDDV